MADDIWVIDGDASGIEKAISKAIKAHSDLIKVERKHIEVVKKLDSEGEASYSASLKGLDKHGKQVLKTYSLVGNKLAETQKKIKETFAATQKASSQRPIQGFVGGKTKGTGSIAEELQLNQAKNALADFVDKNKVSLAKVKSIWQDVSEGTVKKYQGELGKVQSLIAKTQKAHKGLGTTQARADEAALRSLNTQVQGTRKVAAAKAAALAKEIAGAERLAAIQDGLFNKAKARTTEQLRAADRLQVRGQVGQSVTSRTPVIRGANVAEQLNLSKAQSDLLDFVQKSKLSTQEVNKVWGEVANGNIKRYSGELNAVQVKIGRVQAAHGNLGKASTAAQAKAAKALALTTEKAAKQREALKGLTFSWQTMFRLIISQAASRAVGSLTTKIHEASSAALEFEQKLAAVQTIDKTQAPFQSWVDSLRQLSDQRGIDLIDQTGAAYQALSNQVGEGLQTINLLREANDLALTGMANSTDTVNLLSSAINAFNIPVEDAKGVAASFFKTVELGRNTIPEMATSFGRLALPAAQLGISLNEVQAAIATTTINGVKFDVASTFLRNTLLSLAKPSDDLSAFLSELGFNSGEAAIAALGLGGFLAKLEAKAKGSSTEISSLFRNIRAISGATVFAGKGIDTFNSNLDAISDSLVTYDSKVKLVTENAGKQFEIASNQIANMFTIDHAVPFLLKIAEITNGFQDLVKATTIAIDVLQVMGAATLPVLIAGAVRATYAFAALSLAFAATPIGALVVAASLLAAGLTTLAVATTTASETAKESFQLWKREFDDLNKKSDETFREMERTAEDYSKQLDRSYRAGFGKVQAQFASMEQLSKGASKEIERAFEASGTGALTKLNNLAKLSKKTFQDLEKASEDLTKASSTAQDELQNLNLDSTLTGLPADAQLEKLTALTVKLGAARKLAANTGDLEGYTRANEQLTSVLERQAVAKTPKSEAFKFLQEQLKVNDAVQQYGVTTTQALRLVGATATKTFNDLANQTNNLVSKSQTIQQEILGLELKDELFGKSDIDQVGILTTKIKRLGKARLQAASSGDLVGFNSSNAQLNNLLAQRSKLDSSEGNSASVLKSKKTELALTQQLTRSSRDASVQAAIAVAFQEKKTRLIAEEKRQVTLKSKTAEVTLTKVLAEVLAAQAKAEKDRYEALVKNRLQLKELYSDVKDLKIDEFKGLTEINGAYARQAVLLESIKKLQAGLGVGDNTQIDAKVDRSAVSKDNANTQANFNEQVESYNEFSRNAKLAQERARDGFKDLQNAQRTQQTFLQDLQSNANTQEGAFFDSSKITPGFADLSRNVDLGDTIKNLNDFWEALDNITSDGATLAELGLVQASLDALNLSKVGSGQQGTQLAGQLQQLETLIANAETPTGILSIQQQVEAEGEAYKTLLERTTEVQSTLESTDKLLREATGASIFKGHIAEAAENMEALERTALSLAKVIPTVSSQNVAREIPTVSSQNVARELPTTTLQGIPAQLLQVTPTRVASPDASNAVQPFGDTVNFNLAPDLGANPAQVARQLMPSIERGLKYRQTTRGTN